MLRNSLRDNTTHGVHRDYYCPSDPPSVLAAGCTPVLQRRHPEHEEISVNTEAVTSSSLSTFPTQDCYKYNIPNKTNTYFNDLVGICGLKQGKNVHVQI